MNCCLSKEARLRKRHEFNRLRGHASTHTGRYILIDYAPSPTQAPRLGIIAPKAFGKAHTRNRFKRLVREAFRLNCQTFPPMDLVIRPRKMARDADFSHIAEEMRTLLL